MTLVKNISGYSAHSISFVRFYFSVINHELVLQLKLYPRSMKTQRASSSQMLAVRRASSDYICSGIVGFNVQHEVEENVKSDILSDASGQASKLGTNTNRRSLGKFLLFARLLKFFSISCRYTVALSRFCGGGEFYN